MRNSATVRLLLQHCVSLSFIALLNGQDARPPRILTMPVMVNGTEGLFLLDTGAEASIIDSAFADSLGLRHTGESGFIQGNSSSEKRPVAIANSFQVGSKSFAGFRLVEVDLSGVSRIYTMNFAGVLGRDVMNTAYLALEYSARTARIVNELHDAGHAIRLKKAEFGFLVPVQIGRLTLEILLDSGTNLTTLSAAAWQGVPSSDRYEDLVVGIRSSATSSSGALGCVPTFTLGKTALHDIPLRVVQPTLEGIFSNKTFMGALGGDILERFRITLDLGHSMMYLKVDVNYQPVPNELNTIGVQLYKTATGTFSVVAVWRRTPAEEAGVETGDEIISVNGVKSADLDLYGLFRQIHRSSGTPIALEVQRRTESLTLKMKTRRLACGSK